ncbi:MAG: endonuclease/exonuclease/phosphatase family protein [Candidatus Saccharimonadaceae bacterium]
MARPNQNKSTSKSSLFSNKKPIRALKHVKLIVVGVLLVIASVGVVYFYDRAPQSDAAGCVSNTYKRSSSATCVKYIEQMVNGITEVYANDKSDFSKEPLNSYMITVDKYYSSNTKEKIINFQRWGYELVDDGIVNAKTWGEICGYAKTIMLTEPKPWSAKITALSTAYVSASCSTAVISSNPNIVYTLASTTDPTAPITQQPAPVETTNNSASFKIASWNVLGGGGSTDNSKENILSGVQSIMSSAQVVGLQEFHNDTKRKYVRDKLLCSSCAYTGYVQNYDYDGSSAASVGIIWNKSAFSLVTKGNIKVSDKISGINDATGTNMSISSKWIAWVKLKEKVTSKEFYLLNTHTVASVEALGLPNTNTVRLANHLKHMNVMTDQIRKFQADNIPIFVTGDFNVNYRYDVENKYAEFPYTRMGALGMRSGWDYMSLGGIDPLQGSHSTGSRIIDYVFSWSRPDVSYDTIAISSNMFGSDHRPVYLGLTLTK